MMKKYKKKSKFQEHTESSNNPRETIGFERALKLHYMMKFICINCNERKFLERDVEFEDLTVIDYENNVEGDVVICVIDSQSSSDFRAKYILALAESNSLDDKIRVEIYFSSENDLKNSIWLSFNECKNCYAEPRLVYKDVIEKGLKSYARNLLYQYEYFIKKLDERSWDDKLFFMYRISDNKQVHQIDRIFLSEYNQYPKSDAFFVNETGFNIIEFIADGYFLGNKEYNLSEILISLKEIDITMRILKTLNYPTILCGRAIRWSWIY